MWRRSFRCSSCTRNEDNLTEVQSHTENCDVEIDNSKKILKKIEHTYDNRVMNDVCLVVNNVEYPAHKMILCTSSDVFWAMLVGSQWSECNTSRIILQETAECAAVFNLFLRYLYTGIITLTEENAIDLLSLSDKYNVKDLTILCIEYMCETAPYAVKTGKILTWLEFVSSVPHCSNLKDYLLFCSTCESISCESFKRNFMWMKLRNKCENVVKWNLEELVSRNYIKNFGEDELYHLLQQSDIVVESEFVLYKYVVTWLDAKRIELKTRIQDDVEIDNLLYPIVMKMMSNIRFGMISMGELTMLLISPLVNKYKDFFIERMAIGVTFHSNTEFDRLKEIKNSEQGKFFFTPRLYTNDIWCSTLYVNNFCALPAYHPHTMVFASTSTLCNYSGEQTTEWVIDFYPKGLFFQKALFIGWRNTIEIPSHVYEITRMTITCREPPETEDLYVKIGILLCGVRNNMELVIEAAYYTRSFRKSDRTYNIDNFLDFSKLNRNSATYTNYFTDESRNSLTMKIIIIPLSKNLSQFERSNYNSTKYS